MTDERTATALALTNRIIEAIWEHREDPSVIAAGLSAAAGRFLAICGPDIDVEFFLEMVRSNVAHPINDDVRSTAYQVGVE